MALSTLDEIKRGDLERRCAAVKEWLQHTKGNVTKAADGYGMERGAFHRFLRQHQIVGFAAELRNREAARLKQERLDRWAQERAAKKAARKAAAAARKARPSVSAPPKRRLTACPYRAGVLK